MIPVIKKVEIGVNKFYLIRKVLPRYFFFLILFQGGRSDHIIVFGFGLILIFWVVSWFFRAINRFIKMLKYFLGVFSIYIKKNINGLLSQKNKKALFLWQP